MRIRCQWCATLAACFLALCAVHAAAGLSCSSSDSLVKVTSAQVPRCTQLNKDITLRWGVKNDIITFAVDAQLLPDTAYLGVGLSELGSMKGADIALFNATADGGWILVDAYATGFQRPVADQSQDLKLLGVQNTNGVLSASWQRYLTPCDQQDLPIPPTKTYVIWAHGSSWGYHGSTNRGSRQVSFLGNDTSADNSAPASWSAADGASKGLKVLEITYPVEIPAQETTYFIKYFKLPSDKKYHILHYQPINNHKMLHHGVAYSCTPSNAAKVLNMTNMGPFDRVKTDMLCEQFYMLLASGSVNAQWTAPADAGLPMGTPDRSVVAIELHYNNPEGIPGQKDKGSGFRIFYTGDLRPHDIGLITLGQDVLNIPPGVANLPANVSVCPTACTKRFKGPLKLLDGFFHMHGLGKSIIARRYRNGRELSPLGELRSWDYGFQGNTPIAADASTLLPGDALTLQCTFDSRDRTNWTYSGMGTRDEMCFYVSDTGWPLH
eukprot:GHUV01003406.1.p1 GENE.GHUV01003406.1~~GHUV01003406.1.p1  ORF type:complete len:494 (+),score=127.29 GHUV01003406.1:164-1645(+)